jgi:CheY-like chemotaxis protein
LLFNAVKHAQADRVSIHLSLDQDDTLRILVEDSGVGFDPAEVVERSNSGQAGWGLFSIRERLTLLGGRLDIESAPGQGTRFRLTAPRGASQDAVVPLLSGAPVETPVSGVADFAPTRALRILIADDHAQVRRVYRGLLEERSELQVVGDASDGVEAVAQAYALRPDVILMDVSMPNMDGIAATRHIRAALPDVQILGLSMQPRTEAVHPIEQAGAAGFYMKGIDTQALVERLLAMRRTLAVTAGGGRPPARVG